MIAPQLAPAPGQRRTQQREQPHVCVAIKAMLSGLMGSWMVLLCGCYAITKGMIYFDRNVYPLRNVLFLCAIPLVLYLTVLARRRKLADAIAQANARQHRGQHNNQRLLEHNTLGVTLPPPGADIDIEGAPSIIIEGLIYAGGFDPSNSITTVQTGKVIVDDVQARPSVQAAGTDV